MTEYLKTHCYQTYTQTKRMNMEPKLACCEAPNIDPQHGWSVGNEYNDEIHHDQHHNHGKPQPLVEPWLEYKVEISQDGVSEELVWIVVFAFAWEIREKTFWRVGRPFSRFKNYPQRCCNVVLSLDRNLHTYNSSRYHLAVSRSVVRVWYWFSTSIMPLNWP